MDLIIEKEDRTVKLNNEISLDLLSNIIKKWDSWNQDRQTQLDNAKLLRESIYMQKPQKKNTIWGSEVHSPKLYELKQTSISNIWQNIYQTPKQMFDVSGKDLISETNANSHKSMLVHSFEEMEIQFLLDKAIDYLHDVGEAIVFVGWEKRIKQIRRLKTNLEKIKEKLLQFQQLMLADVNIANENLKKLFTKSDNYLVVDVIDYDGVKVKEIPPEYFSYDVTRSDNWDSCGKIYKTWMTYDEIKANKTYKIDSSKEEILKNIGKVSNTFNTANSTATENDKTIDYQDAIKGDQLEILEYWGDIKLTDGTLLKNYLIVVAARTEIIRFEANPYIINPFVKPCCIIRDPKTLRGVSHLFVALPLVNMLEQLQNKKLDALSLTIEPDYLAPKGSLSGKITRKPGAIHEYDPSLMPREPFPIPVNYEAGWDFIEKYNSELSDATGIYPNMSGAIDSPNETATAVKARIGGQTGRQSMIREIISQNLIIPMVKKVAELTANYKFGEEQIMTMVNGINKPLTVNDEIRQGDFKYIYSDTSSSELKKLEADELSLIVEKFMQLPDFQAKVDVIRLFEYITEKKGYDDVERIYKDEQESQPPPPSPNAITAEMAIQSIMKTSLPDNLKIILLQELGLQQNVTNQQTESTSIVA